VYMAGSFEAYETKNYYWGNASGVIYHLQPTENYHSKSHSHGTKNMEVILDQKASDVKPVQVKLMSW
jgi:hypothetical protein